MVYSIDRKRGKNMKKIEKVAIMKEYKSKNEEMQKRMISLGALEKAEKETGVQMLDWMMYIRTGRI